MAGIWLSDIWRLVRGPEKWLPIQRVVIPEYGHSSLCTGGVAMTGETPRERGWLYPESQSRAGTFLPCPFAAFVLRDRTRAHCTLACLRGSDSHIIASEARHASTAHRCYATPVCQGRCSGSCPHSLASPHHQAVESTITTPVSMFPLEDTEAERCDEVTKVMRAPGLKSRHPRSQPRLPPTTPCCTCSASWHLR